MKISTRSRFDEFDGMNKSKLSENCHKSEIFSIPLYERELNIFLKILKLKYSKYIIEHCEFR